MNIRATFWALVGLLGLAVDGWGGLVVVRGPFLGGELARGTTILLALVAFVVGPSLVALGSWKAIRARMY